MSAFSRSWTQRALLLGLSESEPESQVLKQAVCRQAVKLTSHRKVGKGDLLDVARWRRGTKISSDLPSASMGLHKRFWFKEKARSAPGEGMVQPNTDPSLSQL